MFVTKATQNTLSITNTLLHLLHKLLTNNFSLFLFGLFDHFLHVSRWICYLPVHQVDLIPLQV